MFDPNKRTLVAGFGQLVRIVGATPGVGEWVDFTVGGAAQADQIAADRTAADPTPGVKYAYANYHMYFMDGGHVRYRYKYDRDKAEQIYNFYDPSKAPLILTPTPEYWEQEGFVDADEWRASLS